MGKNTKQFLAIFMSCTFVLVQFPLIILAQSSSSQYRVEESYFGVGGQVDATSGNYRSRGSLGELGTGTTTSPNYSSESGFNTGRDPYIEMVVNTATVNLGTVTSGATSSGSATFSVKSYLSSGYVVQTASDPPSNGVSTIAALTNPTASNSSAEQFGINLVANTTPAIGANPVQIPDSSFSFGTAETGYNTANQFKYVKGDTIARSTKSSGQTNFTISYIFNISQTTKAGSYRMSHSLVVVGTF